ncbi:MAG: YbaK/EbsC family protein [Actinomycetota bacterium]|nr:YbaK/EbsC family protein [Actinomycetota bacterium]
MTSPEDPAAHSPAARADVLAHPAVVRVRAAIAAHLVTTTVVVLDGAARTAREAADQLGVSIAQIANSLVFAARATPGADPSPLLVLVSGAHRVDTVKVAAALDLIEVERADAEFVRAATGFVIGGVAPVGHPHPVRTVIDVSLSRYDTIWAAAGHPHAVFRTTYDELIRMSGGRPTEVV